MGRNRGMRREKTALAVVGAVTLSLIVYRNFSVFVLPPDESSHGATLLIERIENQRSPVQKKVITSDLVVRGSTSAK